MIKYIKCDIFESGADVICHQVNCQGVMGSGVAKQVKERYPYVFEEYKKQCDILRLCGGILFGTIQIIEMEKDKYISNLFTQDKYGYDGTRYTDYLALRNCLRHVYKVFKNTGKTIAFPYLMSCARGDRDWNIVYKMIEDIFKDYDGNILICEYDRK